MENLLTVSRVSGDIVTIIAGAELPGETETFCVHESELRSHGVFFGLALKKEWAEGQSKRIEMPTDLPAVVGAYIEYMYRRKLPKWCSTEDEELQETKDQIQIELEHLARSYVLGERCQDDGLRAATSARFVELTNRESIFGLPMDPRRRSDQDPIRRDPRRLARSPNSRYAVLEGQFGDRGGGRVQKGMPGFYD